MRDIVRNMEDDGYVKNYQLLEIIKKNTEIKKRQKGEPFSANERRRYETPDNLWRDTLAIESNKDNIFKAERDAFINNFNDFLNNLDINEDPSKLQEQVDSYIEQCRVYNQNRNGKLKQLEMMNTKRASDEFSAGDKVNKSLLRCVRREKPREDLLNGVDNSRHAKSFINKNQEKQQKFNDDSSEEEDAREYEQNKDVGRKRMEEQLKNIKDNLAKRNEKKVKRAASEDSLEDSPKNGRQSIPIANNSPKEQGFFSKIWSFIPFTCAGRSGQEYGYASDEDSRQSRKRERQKQPNKNKQKKRRHRD